MAFSLIFICFCIFFTTRRSFQPGWQSQNCLCFGTALMRHLTKHTGSVACQNGLFYLFVFENVYNKKHVSEWSTPPRSRMRAWGFVALVRCFIKAVSKHKQASQNKYLLICFCIHCTSPMAFERDKTSQNFGCLFDTYLSLRIARWYLRIYTFPKRFCRNEFTKHFLQSIIRI